ncbi:MAG: substrate-binding domain-containing protein [Opitutaceae bacterium]|nr:substrate-binding domain-containing protein [Opitutaceae bacterium]
MLAPRREFLSDQVAQTLRREISVGRWVDWLPSERNLVRLFNVSRGTLRAALGELRQAGDLSLVAQRGYRIRRRSAAAVAKPVPVSPQLVIICPERIHSMPSYVVKVLDLVRSMSVEAGLQLEVLEGTRFSRMDPGRFMPPLQRSHPQACWIPIMAHHRLQQWFARSGAPAVIYGNVYPNLPLTAVGIDYHACIRHATSVLLRRGHRRIALVTHDLRRAGDQESLAGFREAFRVHPETDLVPTVVARPDDDVAALRRQIDRLAALRLPPSAYIVCRTHHYAAVATRLMELGRRIPGDVSMICRGEEVFLRFLSPTPTFYRVNVETLARRLFRCVLRVVGGALHLVEQHRVVPDFVPGSSVSDWKNESGHA